MLVRSCTHSFAHTRTLARKCHDEGGIDLRVNRACHTKDASPFSFLLLRFYSYEKRSRTYIRTHTVCFLSSVFDTYLKGFHHDSFNVSFWQVFGVTT